MPPHELIHDGFLSNYNFPVKRNNEIQIPKAKRIGIG
jgi:hypothetical protein